MMSLSAQTPPDDPRILQAKAWLTTGRSVLQAMGLELALDTCRPASSDASFRRYFRFDAQIDRRPGHLILMDAPPDKEDIRPFIAIGHLLEKAGVSVPRIWQSNADEGFLLCSDLGQQTYLAELRANESDPDRCTLLYQDAWRALITMQSFSITALTPCPTSAVPAVHGPTGLNAYGTAKLMQEMRLFDEWYLGRHAPIALTNSERNDLMQVYDRITAQCLAQPAVIVHRDYHSRNLMVTPDRNPGVLDFQDAVLGPITYDLVSLLRDAYIEWPEEIQIDWAVRYWQDARAARLPVSDDFGEFWRDFEWMGLQRHIKVLGIFARLYYRDGKENYLKDLPVVMRYAQSVARRYQGLGPLAKILERCA
jgi:N-acetylmuramate 1-kinase